MIKKAFYAALIIFGAGLVFSKLLQSGAGPKATFPLDGTQLVWLSGKSGLGLALEESGARNVPGAPNACYATRTLSFNADGTATIRQTCTDDENRTFIDAADATWRIEDGRLCLDTRPLDRDPACWRIIYRDGTLEFENTAHTLRWFARPIGVGTTDEFLQMLQSAPAS